MNEETKKRFKESAEQAIEKTNKESLYNWLKSIALGLWGLITIITCACVWNSDADAFSKVMTAILFVINGAAIIWVAIKYHPYKDKK